MIDKPTDEWRTIPLEEMPPADLALHPDLTPTQASVAEAFGRAGEMVNE